MVHLKKQTKKNTFWKTLVAKNIAPHWFPLYGHWTTETLNISICIPHKKESYAGFEWHEENKQWQNFYFCVNGPFKIVIILVKWT